MPDWTNDQLIDAIDDILRTTVSLARDIPEAEADRPTECPGWTVRDQLAHMVGLEQVLSGAPQPSIDLPPLDHVASEFDEYMERQIHIRRNLPLSAIADELDGLRPRRIAQLRVAAAKGDPDVPAPFGARPMSRSLPIRVFDLWVHEQDIRRAMDLPVRQQGDAAAVALDRALQGWTGGLPGKLDGVSGEVVIEVTGPAASRTSIRLGTEGARATITGDLGELTRLFSGRSGPSANQLHGDTELVDALRDQLAMTP